MFFLKSDAMDQITDRTSGAPGTFSGSLLQKERSSGAVFQLT
jgi:hypothetical protein